MTAAKEATKGGMIDIVTSVMANHVNLNKEKEKYRQRVNAEIYGQAALRSASSDLARVSLEAGLK